MTVKNREFAAPAVGRLAVDDFQNFGTFWRRLAGILHHLPVVRKIWLVLPCEIKSILNAAICPTSKPFSRANDDASLVHSVPRECGLTSLVVIASEAKQSRISPRWESGLLRPLRSSQ
jgi:hypothetical protein